jgi:hypothetical protein
MEENRSEDIGCDVVRIFDVNPKKVWPQKSNIMIGAGQFLKMPFVEDDKNRTTYLKDGVSPITWFLTMGTVRQQKLVLLYEVLPFLMEQEAFDTQVLWCPFPYVINGQDFRQDTMEVLDGFEKLMEFNARYDTNFTMGLGKLWLPQGSKYDKDRAYICRMGAAVDMIGYHYIHSRVLPLGNFTTTDEKDRKGVSVDVENHTERKFVAEQYLSDEGYVLKDYCMRTIRQKIRKVFLEEGVVPSDWTEAKKKQLIKIPGYWEGDEYRFYEAPSGAPFRAVMLERANLRVLFGRRKSGKNTLPAITGFKFALMNVGSPTVGRLILTKMAPQRPGVRVKELEIPAGYTSFPESAMTRFDQERGERLSEKRIVIPKDDFNEPPVLQVVSAPATSKKVIAAPRQASNDPDKTLAAKQTEEEKIVKKELERIVAAREEEKRRQPTSLAGAIRELNIVNAPVKKLAVVSRVPLGAQQRLRPKEVTVPSEELKEEEKKPEKSGEGGTTSRNIGQTASLPSVVPPSILTESEEESDSEEMDKIREQRHIIKMEEDKLRMEIEKLQRMERRHAKERRQKK